MSIRSILAELPKRKKFRAGSPATQKDVAAIEEALGVKLPEDYKVLLREFGMARWFGNSINGIHTNQAEKDAGYSWDVVEQTRYAQAEWKKIGLKALPKDAVVINRYDAGGWYVLFCADSPRSGQVALFDHEAMGEEAQSWKSLEEFLKWLS